MIKGLVLAGGGARGSYQVGVYEALLEMDWKPGVIAGTSVGCLNGAMFAMDKPDMARSMWLTIGDEQIMKKPQDPSGQELYDFLQDVIRRGGMDVSPLEETVRRALDEEKLRKGDVRFGLVTVNKRTMKPLQLTLKEIPEGRLLDYMLASAACFPAFCSRSIDGEEFIDGGYNDNMPFALAARMGADELIAVDVDGIGITRPNLTGLPTTCIRSQWNLGGILEFDPETARRNMALGYQDCCRAFGKLLGTAYALRLDSRRELLERFVRPYAKLMRQVIGRSPALALTERAAMLPMEGIFTEEDRSLIPLEQACRLAGVEPAQIYSAQEIFDAFLEKCPEEETRRFDSLLTQKEDGILRAAAQAAAAPGDFLKAMVRAALTGVQEDETTTGQ